jgi:hypothetical protein
MMSIIQLMDEVRGGSMTMKEYKRLAACAELSDLNLRQLSERAAQEGCTADNIDLARNADLPRFALEGLIRSNQLHQRAKQEGCPAQEIEVALRNERKDAALDELIASNRALEEARAAKRAADDQLMELDKSKVAQLKGYKVPPTAVHAVFQAVMLLKGGRIKDVKDWAASRKLVDISFLQSLREFDIERAAHDKKIGKKRAAGVETLLQQTGGEQAAERASIVALVMFRWCMGCLAVYNALLPNDVMELESREHREEVARRQEHYEGEARRRQQARRQEARAPREASAARVRQTTRAPSNWIGAQGLFSPCTY